jgi:hypothetical protein
MKLVNIDWLEVYCLAPDIVAVPNAIWFRSQGWDVKTRDYGTPQYKEVFTRFDADHFPLYEIRRDPYSLKQNGGIFDPRACHIRLSNRACYQKNCIGLLRDFILRYGYELKSVSRVDICADFNKFDNGKDPQRFLADFMHGDWLKIHQSRLAAHGIEYLYQNGVKTSTNVAAYAGDSIGGRAFNSIKWGSPTSAISTKMYNKTMELKQGKPKKYIQARWKQAGLLNDDANPVWRVEFSLSSSIKNFVRLDTGELIYMNLTTIDTPEKLNGLFAALSQVYFHFKYKSRTRNGTPQRKDRCKDYFPFTYNPKDAIKPVTLPLTKDPTRTDRMIMRRLKEFFEDREHDMTTKEKQGVLSFIDYLAESFDDDELREFKRREEDFLYLLRYPT